MLNKWDQASLVPPSSRGECYLYLGFWRKAVLSWHMPSGPTVDGRGHAGLNDVTRDRGDTIGGLQRTTSGCAAAPRARRAPTECGNLPFVICRDGTWLYRGSPIGRKELVCLFASVLRREEDGSFWLQTPAERGRIEVEDAPFLAVALDWTGFGREQVLTFRTNVDQMVTAGPDHPIRIAHDILTCEPTPYLLVRPGAGRLPVEARISRAVYYELVALAEPHHVHGRRMLGVWSRGCFFPLGELAGEAGGTPK
jgi:uncharacterized protein